MLKPDLIISYLQTFLQMKNKSVFDGIIMDWRILRHKSFETRKIE